MKTVASIFKFHYNLGTWLQLTISQHWFKYSQKRLVDLLTHAGYVTSLVQAMVCGLISNKTLRELVGTFCIVKCYVTIFVKTF